MRTEDEIASFCLTICCSAKNLNISIRKNDLDGKVSFTWLDRLTGTIIESIYQSDAKKALESACETLIEYLNHGGPTRTA